MIAELRFKVLVPAGERRVTYETEIQRDGLKAILPSRLVLCYAHDAPLPQWSDPQWAYDPAMRKLVFGMEFDAPVPVGVMVHVDARLEFANPDIDALDAADRAAGAVVEEPDE